MRVQERLVDSHQVRPNPDPSAEQRNASRGAGGGAVNSILGLTTVRQGASGSNDRSGYGSNSGTVPSNM